MTLLTNGPNIIPDDSWQNNTLLDNAEPSGYVRFSLNMFRVTDTDPAPPPDTPPNPPLELALPPGPSSPGHSPLRSPTRTSSNVASPIMLLPYVRSEHTQAAYPTDSCRIRECNSLGHTAPSEHLLAFI